MSTATQTAVQIGVVNKYCTIQCNTFVQDGNPDKIEVGNTRYHRRCYAIQEQQKEAAAKAEENKKK